MTYCLLKSPPTSLPNFFFFAEDPTFVTLTPHPSITRSSSSTFVVPLGYSGTVVTCLGLGLPTPTIQWRQDGQNLGSDGDVQSELSQTEDSPLVEARLRWNRGFADSDEGAYECIVRGSEDHTMNRSQSAVVMLVASNATVQNSYILPVAITAPLFVVFLVSLAALLGLFYSFTFKKKV